MYVILLVGLALCMVTILYWISGRWMISYGIHVKIRSVRLLRAAGSVLAAVFSIRWSIFGLIIAYLIALSLLAECIATAIRRAAGKLVSAYPYVLLRRGSSYIAYLSGFGLWCMEYGSHRGNRIHSGFG